MRHRGMSAKGQKRTFADLTVLFDHVVGAVERGWRLGGRNPLRRQLAPRGPTKLVVARSRQGTFLQPVDVEQAFGKEPCSVDLCESVEVAQTGDHQASSFAVHCEVMCDAVGFARGASTVQREDCALSDEMHRRGIPIQVREDRGERPARMQLLRRLWILGVHVYNEMGVGGEQRHLAFRIATIGAAGVGLDELTDGEAIRGFRRRDCDVFAQPSSL